jgi:maternal embryonic leucine zipper kinase
VELDLNQVHVVEPKVFESLGRRWYKDIAVLTRSKREGSAKDMPERLKLHCNVTTTRLVNPNQLLSEIMSVIPEKQIDFVQKCCTLNCQTQSDFDKMVTQFEVEICQLQKPNLVGVRRQQLKGDT